MFFKKIMFCLSLLFGKTACKAMMQSHILRSLSAPASSSVCKFSLRYPHKTSCLVMRIKQLITHPFSSSQFISM